MIQCFKVKFAENVYFPLSSVNIGIKFWTHAVETFLPAKERSGIIVIRLMI